MIDDSSLNRPVWSALTSLHAPLSVGEGGARRFQSDVSPLAGLQDDGDDSLVQLGKLVSPGERIVIAQNQSIPCPSGLKVNFAALALQMIFTGGQSQPDTRADIVRLGETDVPDMLALAVATQPGPYRINALRMGAFWGIKLEGRLVSMAGERLRQPGFTEVSGVCTYPEFRGKGFGRALSSAVIDHILGREEVPYLHVFSSNETALKLYEMLGFEIRCEMHVAELGRV